MRSDRVQHKGQEPKNTAATHLVAFASLASRVLALFLERKDAAAPAMAPDRPAFYRTGAELAQIRNRDMMTLDHSTYNHYGTHGNHSFFAVLPADGGRDISVLQ